jgi:hypothetical protein
MCHCPVGLSRPESLGVFKAYAPLPGIVLRMKQTHRIAAAEEARREYLPPDLVPL